MMTVDEFGYSVSYHLKEIRAGADIIARHVDQMVFRPVFETLARDELGTLQQTLEHALSVVRKAGADYDRKQSVD